MAATPAAVRIDEDNFWGNTRFVVTTKDGGGDGTVPIYSAVDYLNVTDRSVPKRIEGKKGHHLTIVGSDAVKDTILAWFSELTPRHYRRAEASPPAVGGTQMASKLISSTTIDLDDLLLIPRDPHDWSRDDVKTIIASNKEYLAGKGLHLDSIDVERFDFGIAGFPRALKLRIFASFFELGDVRRMKLLVRSMKEARDAQERPAAEAIANYILNLNQNTMPDRVYEDAIQEAKLISDEIRGKGVLGNFIGDFVSATLDVLPQQLSLPLDLTEGIDLAKEKAQSAWVKLCEKSPVVVLDKEGKPSREMRNICLTHHERIDGNSGIVVISAALRQVEGEQKQHLMLMVPLGTALPPGLRAKVFNAEQWDKIQKNEKFDDSKVEQITFNFSFCHQAGCTAEIEATKELIDAFKAGSGLMVLGHNAQRQLVAFPVPLTGFTEALNGEPIDNQKYSEARRAVMLRIAQRQRQLTDEERKRIVERAQKGGVPIISPTAPK